MGDDCRSESTSHLLRNLLPRDVIGDVSIYHDTFNQEVYSRCFICSDDWSSITPKSLMFFPIYYYYYYQLLRVIKRDFCLFENT